ncbi:ABC transporter ATP-binding protein [Streptomyces sp. ventii]|uniref:ABC transporter ATP-binding protein n=1 Tax=Streptomyces spiramenti TaxID=2720606 RepID=A0ABX1ASZ6_9ACTN|nr:ABC transporter ATP-binding protein [Streptomyces spiramenti]NJP67407.1 ABC transporter ATP-binding protein [Streptomyces spiramenti]
MRRVGREGVPFLRQRRRAVLRLAAWSLVEFAQTFLTGFGIAQALDQGFLAGRPGVGLAWLTVAAVAALPAAATARGLFGRLGDLVEPLRDGLVRRASARALHEALARPEWTHTGAVSRATHQSEIARDGWAGLVMATRSCLFTGAGALVGLAVLAPPLLLVVVPPILAGWGLFLATLVPMAGRQRAYLEADERLAEHTGAVAGGLRDLAATGGGASVAARYSELADEQCDAARALARWSAVRVVALSLCGRVPPVALLAATPWLLDRGMTAGALVGALAYLTQSLAPAVQALMTALGTAGGRLLVVLDRFSERPAELPAGRAAGVPAPREGAPGCDGRRRTGHPRRPGGVTGATLRGVRFTYGPGARPVLDGLDLRVAPGEHLTVIGPSGTGKSTLAGLLTGDRSPVRGSVSWERADGTGPADAVPPGVVLLPQHPYVFTGSLRDNLRYLAPDAGETETAAAIDALGMRELTDRLGGLDATVRPGALSLGERQLVVLARAFVAAPSLLVLDEATGRLDAAAEARAETALAARAGTLVVIAHRPASARRADRVLVLDGPEVALGTPAGLAASSALYRELTGEPRSSSPASADGR